MIRIEWTANCRDVNGRRGTVQLINIDGMIALTLPRGEIAYFTMAEVRQLHTAMRRAANLHQCDKTPGAGIAFSTRAGTDAAGRPSDVSSPQVSSVAARHPSRGEVGPTRLPGLTAPQPPQQE